MNWLNRTVRLCGGRFTGARKGGQKASSSWRRANIFDEIGELPLYLQAKLLRVLESNEIQKIGMSGSKYSDFRLIAATNRNLPELVDKRQFREDLYHRLNILELNLPPLRKHRGDIPSLITQLIEGICGPQKALEMRVSQDVLDLFMRYGWPGNVRELKNVLAYAYCCMDDDAVELTPRYLPERLFMGSRSEDVHAAEDRARFLQAMQREAEKRAIESALSLAGGNKSKAAKLLGFSRNTLYLKMKALGMGLKRK
ncbi:MAG: sigma 54-interacting transcriptional regulator [Bilophila wadsworthia]